MFTCSPTVSLTGMCVPRGQGFSLILFTAMSLAPATPVAQRQRICLPTQEMPVRSLSREDPPEESKATHSSILAWRIPWTEEPSRLQSMGSQELDTTERVSTHTAYKKMLLILLEKSSYQ